MLDENVNMNSSEPGNEDLHETMEELRKGSAEAFRILYKKNNKKVYRFEHRKEFRGSNFAAWLFTIARHTCLNTLRTRKEHDDFDEFFYKPAIEKQTDVGLKSVIDEALAALPVPLREAVILREYEDCSYQDIADILGIQLSLAKVMVHRAREILRKFVIYLI